jgi:hypothetical protein
MALLPGGVRPRFGGAPNGGVSMPQSPVATPPVTPQPQQNGGAAPPPVNGGAVEAKPTPKPEREEKSTALIPSYLADEMEMPMDMEDADFDDEMLRLANKTHLILVEELGGQQFNSNDRERLRPVAQQVMNDVLKDEKPLMPKRKAVLLEEVLNEVLGFADAISA